MTQRILFVCLGNICRSPTAEAVARTHLEDAKVDSAGTAHWHVGKAPYGPMQIAAAKRGYAMQGLRARQVTTDDFDSFDLILGMDAENLSMLETLRPKEGGAPVQLLTDFAPRAGMDHVPDPYYTRDFDAALDLIETCVHGLRAAL